MSRYRKVETRMWGDARFRALSPLPPSGQSLWLWLLTGPQTGIVPGLWSMGEAGMAELLRWSPKAFRDAFAEVLREGIVKADFEAPLVWLPNAIKYNSPQSPNVVKSWADAWMEIPECPLKVIAWQRLKDFLEGMSDAFGEAFLMACPMPLANQEQEQELEQEQETQPLSLPLRGNEVSDPAEASGANGHHPKPTAEDDFERWWSHYPKRVGKRKALALWKRLRKAKELPTVEDAIAALDKQAKSSAWTRDGGQYIPHPTTYLGRGGWGDDLSGGRPCGADGMGAQPRGSTHHLGGTEELSRGAAEIDRLAEELDQ